ncbi:adenylylsulfate kinase [Geomicrobium halophilum]|uniref:Adenylyl-sulfate kinase n=1 Tax=Geomicrobium halophilum TaxID=549000 RepID=A0A841PI04_9BACL|nr:adenylyl-sulfate kinase [Geomicrobium halophilum]MBB6448517.1 adenylylsulfate kinase [Geomicrobium halophilum]
MANSDIVWHETAVTKAEREKQNGHPGFVLWFTGLSGSGKSTLANAVDRYFYDRGYRSYVLDGDNIRHGLNQDLGFSAEDREENIRRISEVAHLFVDAGTIVSTAFISPYETDRAKARELLPEGRFIEVFVECPLETCEDRDPKGLYKKARSGEIPSFTGISAPYELPRNPEVTLRTGERTSEENVQDLIEKLAPLLQNE